MERLKLFVVPDVLLFITLVVMEVAGVMLGILPGSIWYDKIMHTLGGAGACVMACWIISNLSGRWRAFVMSVGLPLFGRASALLIGGFWEVAEAMFPVMTLNVLQGSWDTSFDLLFDYIGGHIAGKVYQQTWEKSP